jgi:hypothetical protein
MILRSRPWTGPKPRWASQAEIDAEAHWERYYNDMTPDPRYAGLEDSGYREPGAIPALNASVDSLARLSDLQDEFVMAAYERAVRAGEAPEVPQFPVYR